ncbi:MAG: recombinase family protein [Candidatus Sericytochromatia bacterium]|nr:recombinase family protein [Candidatus Tanganyikabacteria bacterium]
MKAIGYTRVSTQEQAAEGYSLAAQEQKIRAYADLYGLELIDLVADADASAKTLDRPGLQSSLARLDAGEAEAHVILKLDRLTRNVADWNDLIERYFGKLVGLMSVSDQIDTRTAAGRLVLNVLVSVAQWEREAIGERTAAALAEKKRQGEHVGRPGFGFEIREGRLVQNDSETAIVDRILALRAAGLTLQAIADRLTAEGVPTKRGGKWAPAIVANLLARAGRWALAGRARRARPGGRRRRVRPRLGGRGPFRPRPGRAVLRRKRERGSRGDPGNPAAAPGCRGGAGLCGRPGARGTSRRGGRVGR